VRRERELGADLLVRQAPGDENEYLLLTG